MAVKRIYVKPKQKDYDDWMTRFRSATADSTREPRHLYAKENRASYERQMSRLRKLTDEARSMRIREEKSDTDTSGVATRVLRARKMPKYKGKDFKRVFEDVGYRRAIKRGTPKRFPPKGLEEMK